MTKDVPAYALVMGNPARQAGWMCVCGVRLHLVDSAATCESCQKRYHKHGDRLVPIVEEPVHA